MDRRSFISLAGGTALAYSGAARAQPAKPLVGILAGETAKTYELLLPGFWRGMNELGFAEHVNVSSYYRWGEGGHHERLYGSARELVVLKPNVIVAFASPAAHAAISATKTIPIVFTSAVDPVAAGLVNSINKPVGNATGVSMFSHTLDAKKLELLRELTTHAGPFGVLVNNASPAAKTWVPQLIGAARSIDVALFVFNANGEFEINEAFQAMVQQRVRGLIVGGGALFRARLDQITSLAVQCRIPAIYGFRYATEVGGLLVYAASDVDNFRQAGAYVGRILKGERPAELPILQPKKFEMAINTRAAKAIGLEIPESFLIRADEVIE